MIQTFSSRETEKIREGSRSTKLPNTIQEIARRKLRMLNNSIDLKDLAIPPSNRLEKLKGKISELYSIRLNDQWSIKFNWIDGHSYNVEIMDYH